MCEGSSEAQDKCTIRCEKKSIEKKEIPQNVRSLSAKEVLQRKKHKRNCSADNKKRVSVHESTKQRAVLRAWHLEEMVEIHRTGVLLSC